MGKKENNNELNLILEQLKKSYQDDSGVSDAESEKSEPSESSDNFQKMLLNFFADENETDDKDSSVSEASKFKKVDKKSSSKPSPNTNKKANKPITQNTDDIILDKTEESAVLMSKNGGPSGDYLQSFALSNDKNTSLNPEKSEILSDNKPETDDFMHDEEIEKSDSHSLREQTEHTDAPSFSEVKVQQPKAEQTTSAKEIDITENNILNQPLEKGKLDEGTAVENVIRLMFANKSDTNRTESQGVSDDSMYEPDLKQTDEKPVVVCKGAPTTETEEPESDPDIISYGKVFVENNIAEDSGLEYGISDSEQLFTVSDRDVTEFVKSDDYLNKETNEKHFSDVELSHQSNQEDVDDIETLLDDIIASRVKSAASKKVKEDYFDDPFQGHLPVQFPVSDISVQNTDELPVQNQNITEAQTSVQPGAVYQEHKDIDNDDISLLLDLGYDEDVNNEAGTLRTEKVKSDARNAYSPDKDNIPFGFCGKEFSEKSQIGEIRKQYSRDKQRLLIRLAGVSVIAVILLFLNLTFGFDNKTESYIIYPVFEVLLLACVCVFSAPGLYKGLKGLVKFEPTVYSLPAVAAALFFLYDIFIISIYFTNETLIAKDKIMLFGTVAAMFFIGAIVSEIAECSSENMAFITVTSSDKIYAAEKFGKKIDENNKNFRVKGNFSDHNKFYGNNVYRIKRTSLPGGYFARTSQKKNDYVKFLFLYAVVPVAAVITGCVSIILDNGIAEVLSSIIFTVFMGYPLAVTIFVSVPKYVLAKKLSVKDCAVIGDVSAEEYAKADGLVFEDTEAISIISSIEMRPETQTDVKKSIRTAARIFAALGGPLSQTLGKNADINDIKNTPDINIASVNDNGIELYMDSSVHVIIGDRSYLSSYGIKARIEENISMSLRAKGNKVIYIAIDGIPRLAYIVVSKIMDEFIETASLLAKNNVRTIVKTYDPAINDVYFEQNRISASHATVSVYKPTDYENPKTIVESDSGIVSVNDCKNIVYPLILCRQAKKRRKLHGRLNVFFAVIGLIVALSLTLMSYFWDYFAWVQSYRAAIVLIYQLIGIIPILLSSSGMASEND